MGVEQRWGGGGRLFEAGRLLTFSAFTMSTYSRWVLILGWALIRINMVLDFPPLPIRFKALNSGFSVNQWPHFGTSPQSSFHIIFEGI